MSEPRTIEFMFPAERGVQDWPRRYARGQVPGEWPYGLEGLRDVAAAELVPLPIPGRVDRLKARLPLRMRIPAGDGSIGLTWDENTAQRMTILRPRTEMYSGIVWVTDLIARGSDTVPALHDVLSGMRAIWANSDAQVGPLREFLAGTDTRVEYFPFGISTEFFSARAYPETPRVISVGGDRDRDAATLFAALAIVAEQRPGTEIVVQNSTDAVPPPGVTKIPRLTHLELREFYAQASVVAIATRPNSHASGATVTLESMATGRPVVATATPGMSAYVRHGETGELVPPGDPQALASAVIALLDDPARAREYGRNARRIAETELTTTHLVDNIARLIGAI